MRVKKRKIKRKFVANKKTNLIISNVGEILLGTNEHLTINVLNKKNEICTMNWGLYATSSINSRLKKEGFLTAFTKNSFNKFFVMLIDKKKIKNFKNYCKVEKIKVIKWLDKSN
mgnify:CR=1 FL=1